MYKNQLQELAQRSCFNLPCYTCIREGPDHAPRFKATVSFNGEVFESAEYHSTLRQAEHAAAEVALTTLSQRGPTQSLAARILDETGVCKNLLQESAQRAGFSLPVYTTIRSGPKHLPLFKCVVEIGGRHFKGEPAKTKKQAEKNAATSAWSALNQSGHMPLPMEHQDVGENGTTVNMSALHNKDDKSMHQRPSLQAQFAARPRVPVTVRDRTRPSRDFNIVVGQIHPGAASAGLVDVPTMERNQGGYLFDQRPVNSLLETNHEMGQRFVSGRQPLCGNPSRLLPDTSLESVALPPRGRGFYHSQASPGSYGGSSRRQGRRHQRRHSLSGVESPMLSQDAMALSRASAGGNMLGRALLHHQQQQIRGLPYQSLSERFELNRPSLLEELQQRDEEDDWFHWESTSSLSHLQSSSVSSSLVCAPGDSMWRTPRLSQSERFDASYISQLEEVHRRDEEKWLCDEPQNSSRHGGEQSLGKPYGYREGWLQGEASPFVDSKNLNYAEGWLRGESLKCSLEEERMHGFREGWLQNSASKQILEKDMKPMSNQQNYVHQERLLNTETAGNFRERDGSYTRGHLFSNDMQNENVYSAASPSPTSFISPFSSLWSKSTQWWGSHIPGSTSSAAAAVASTFGLRPPRSTAPAVKVRQMVPVCSAPPPRHPDSTARRHHLHNDSSYADKEPEARQLLSKLRL